MLTKLEKRQARQLNLSEEEFQRILSEVEEESSATDNDDADDDEVYEIGSGTAVEIGAALKKLPRSALKKVLDAAGVHSEVAFSDVVERQRRQIGTLQQMAREAFQEAQRYSNEFHRTQRDSILERALSEGRLLPKDLAFWANLYDKDPDSTTAAIERLPKAISYETYGVSGSMGGVGGGATLSDDDREAMRLLGMDEKTYRKYAGLEG